MKLINLLGTAVHYISSDPALKEFHGRFTNSTLRHIFSYSTLQHIFSYTTSAYIFLLNSSAYIFLLNSSAYIFLLNSSAYIFLTLQHIFSDSTLQHKFSYSTLQHIFLIYGEPTVKQYQFSRKKNNDILIMLDQIKVDRTCHPLNDGSFEFKSIMSPLIISL